MAEDAERRCVRAVYWRMCRSSPAHTAIEAVWLSGCVLSPCGRQGMLRWALVGGQGQCRASEVNRDLKTFKARLRNLNPTCRPEWQRWTFASPPPSCAQGGRDQPVPALLPARTQISSQHRAVPGHCCALVGELDMCSCFWLRVGEANSFSNEDWRT